MSNYYRKLASLCLATLLHEHQMNRLVRELSGQWVERHYSEDQAKENLRTYRSKLVLPVQALPLP